MSEEIKLVLRGALLDLSVFTSSEGTDCEIELLVQKDLFLGDNEGVLSGDFYGSLVERRGAIDLIERLEDELSALRRMIQLDRY